MLGKNAVASGVRESMLFIGNRINFILLIVCYCFVREMECAKNLCQMFFCRITKNTKNASDVIFLPARGQPIVLSIMETCVSWEKNFLSPSMHACVGK